MSDTTAVTQGLSPRLRSKTWRAAAIVLGIDLLVLAATGVYLMLRYRPTAAQAWPTLKASVAAKPWLLSFSETAHKVSAWAALLGAVALIAICLVTRWRSSALRRVVVLLGGVLLLAGLVLGLVRGSRLRWDQLALSAVTVKSVEGVWLPASTKFVLIGSSEIGPSDFRSDVWFHIALVATLVAVGFVVVVVATASRRRQVSIPTTRVGRAGDRAVSTIK